MTGLEFDFEHLCKTCAHFTIKAKAKVKRCSCALAPQHDGNTFGQSREAFPACVRWRER